MLYSVQGFQYCDLLLGRGKHREVRERAGQALEWAKLRGFPLDTAMNHLSLGRACLLKAQHDGNADFARAGTHLDHSVEGLRRAGAQEFIALGLLARAALHRVRRDFDRTRDDLDEALAIATRSGMKLHEADAHLESARLHLALGEKDQARKALAQAKAIIETTGYHRRDPDVAELESQLL